MRIKELRLNKWNVIREADFENLSDFVVIAGPNGVGKTQDRWTPKTGQSYKVVKYTTKRRRIHRYGQDEVEQVFSGVQG